MHEGNRQGKEGGDIPDLTVIVPACNEALIIEQVVSSLITVLKNLDLSSEVLVIDDGSEDETAIIAQAAGAQVFRHPYTIGNGAAIKTGIRNAKGAILVMMDGDGQHNAQDIPRLIENIGMFDMV